MVRDAEANAGEDRRIRELTESRNQGDALVHATRKSVTEYGDKVDAAGKEQVETAIRALEDVLKGDDKQAIDSRIAALGEAAAQMAAAASSCAQQTEPGRSTADAANDPEQGKDDVVDADFKEVKK
jgi:molecular chaperone DnaK